MSLATANAPIKQTTANAQNNPDDICDPVVYVGVTIEAGLDEFDDTAEGARADEDRQQAHAARARQRERKCGEG